MQKDDVLEHLAYHKNSDVAIVLGSGSSINAITDKEWKAIHRFDTWAVNNWVYHPIEVPKFYMIETKWYAYEILQRRLEEKKMAYRDTIFLFPENKAIRMKDGRTLKLRNVLPEELCYFEVPLISRGNRSDTTYTAKYKFKKSVIHKSYDMSMTSLIEILYRLGYEKVILYGIDLYNSLYFWSNGDPKYGEVHHLWNKQHEDRDPYDPHNTSRIRHFVISFNKRFKKARREIFVGNRCTLLYPHLQYIDVTEI